jgi:hypothetical protein
MGLKFNPFSGNFDFTGSGGGGGGSAFFAGEVATYADLPLDGTAALNSRWLVRSNSGTWPFSTYKQAGIYIRIGTVGSDRDDDYQLTDTSFHDVMSDDAFLIFDNTDPTKAAKFDVGTNVPTSSTVTLTVPASSGTIALTSQLGGGTKTYAVFTATDNQPPATAFATLDTRNSIAVLDFDDTTDESAVFVGIIPEAASLGSGLKIRLHWMSTNQTSNNVVWDVSLERMTTDLDSDSFDTIASGTAAANTTQSGILTVTEITLTTIDSVTAGDGYRLKVTRDANNASDTMTGDAELIAVEVRSAA